MARKMISLAIVVIMVLGMAFAIAEEEKKVRLTTVSDAEVTTLLEKSNWMYTAEEESGELPAFLPVSRGFHVYKGAYLELPKTARVNFDINNHLVGWHIEYIKATEGSINPETKIITGAFARTSPSRTEEFTQMQDDEIVFWEIKDHYLNFYTYNEDGSHNVFGSYGIRYVYSNGIVVIDMDTGRRYEIVNK